MDDIVRHSLVRIEKMLHRQHTLLEIIMSGEDDLKAALAANAQAVTAVTAELNSLAKQIVAAANGDSDADIETLAQQMQAQTAQLNLAISNATQPAAAAVQNTGGAASPVAPAQTLAPQTTTGLTAGQPATGTLPADLPPNPPNPTQP